MEETQVSHTDEPMRKNVMYPYNGILFSLKTGGDSGFPGSLDGKESACQCRRCKIRVFDPWVGKISWRRERQPTPVFLPGESPWTEEPGGLQSMGLQRVGLSTARTRLNKYVLIKSHSDRPQVLLIYRYLETLGLRS